MVKVAMKIISFIVNESLNYSFSDEWEELHTKNLIENIDELINFYIDYFELEEE